MDTRVIVCLIVLFAVAFANHPDDDLTQIFQSQQEDEEDVQANSVQQGDASDLTQSEQEEEQEVQPNSAEQEAASDLTQIFEGEQEEVEQGSVEQESEAETADGAPECGVARVQHCLLPIRTFVTTEEDDNNEACEAVRSAYNCLKDMADSCLHGEERESVQPTLNQIKSAMDANCNFDDEKSEEHKCIDSMRIDLKECLYKGIIQTWSKFKKTGENDVERFKCMAYGAIADCQTDKILAKCGEVAAEQFHDYMADLPEEIREACDVANEQHEDIYIYELQLLQSLTRRRK